MRGVRPLVVAAMIAIFVATSQASAREHAGLELARGPATETCPSEEELRGAVLARLGYDPFDRAVDAPIFRVRFVKNRRTFVASIDRRPGGKSTATEEGVRELTSENCADLLAPTAITLSIAIDPLASPAAQNPPSQKETPAPAPAVPAEAT